MRTVDALEASMTHAHCRRTRLGTRLGWLPLLIAGVAIAAVAAGCSGEGSSSGAADTTADAPSLPDGAADSGADVAAGDAKPTGDATVGPDTAGDDGAAVDVPPPDVASDDAGEDDVAPLDVTTDDVGEDDVREDDVAPGDVSPTCGVDDPCDDGDPCTSDDRCDADGACAGLPVVCDDGRPCTEDVCDETGSCAARLRDGWCLLDATCVEEAARPDGNPCAVCDPAADPAHWTADDDAACDDGDACTTGDHCAAGACIAAAAVPCPEGEACADFVCDASTGDCVRTPHGGLCDDDSACTTDDHCLDGACVGFEVLCGGSDPCVAATCEPLVGCVEIDVEGSCDDGDACSTDDFCLGGVCVGRSPADCDDGNPCTADLCHWLLGCDHQPIDSPCCEAGLLACDDGDPCTADDCDEVGDCTHAGFVGPCDDGDACTDGDVCDEAGACLGAAVDCDDDNECTADSCDAYLGCRNLPTAGACDDGDPCTESDECRGGACEGRLRSCNDGVDCTRDFCDATGACQNMLESGLPCSDDDACTAGDACDANGECAGTTIACDDQNDCTDDACVPATGCVFTPNAETCDDGDECTTDDACVAGVCIGTPGGCGCQPALADDASKVTRFAIGATGQPGDGLDVDGDPATCTPANNCSAGIDNSMAGLASLANGPIEDAVVGGSLVFLFAHDGLRADGEPYTVGLLTGDPTSVGACDFQTATCDYQVSASSFDADTCAPRIAFDNATIVGSAFAAGGPGYTFPFEIPIQGLVLSIDLFNARLQGTATFENGALVALTGVIGGAVPKQQLIDAVNALPDDQFPEGITKELVLTLLGALIRDDIDIDGNGTPDAASIGILFDAIDANLVGVAE